MTKSQIVLVTVSVAAVVLLFNLPRKALQESTRGGMAQSNTGSGNNSQEESHESHSHASELDENEKTLLASLTSALQKEGVLGKRIQLADSTAKIYRDNFEYDSAAKYYDMVIKLKPSKEALVRAADNYNDASNFITDQKLSADFADKARAIYQQLLTKYPEDLDVKSKMAMTYVASPQPMQGIMLLREVIAKDPKNKTALFNLGLLSVKSGQYEKAVGRFEELIAVDSKNAQAYFYLGISYKELKETEKAKVNFNKVLELEKNPDIVAAVKGQINELK